MSPAPTPAERTPNRTRQSFTCPICGTYAAQEWRELGYQVDYEDGNYPTFLLSEPEPEPDPDPDLAEVETAPWDAPSWVARSVWDEISQAPWLVGSTWAQSACNGCKEVATWRRDLIIYPKSSTAPLPHEDMPESVLPLYMEARDVVSSSRRGAAALARATMEALLRELDTGAPKGARLDDRILRIESKVSSGLGDLLTFIRHVGNQSLHVAGVPDDAVLLMLDPGQNESVEVIFEAINALVDELKTKPERSRRLTALVPKSVMDNVERKRKLQDLEDGGERLGATEEATE